MDWLTTFTTLDVTLAEKVARTIAVYLGIALLLRLAGKRLLAEMNSLDLVVVLLLSNVVQNAIIGPDNSVLGGMVGAVVLIGSDLGLDLLTQRFGWLNALFVGPATVLLRDGKLDHRRLAQVGISDRELALALRRQGVDELAQVGDASLEPGGELLVSLKPSQRSVTRADLDEAVAELRALITAGPTPAAGPAGPVPRP